MFRKKKRNLYLNPKKKIITPKMLHEIFSWLFVTVVAIFFAFVFVIAFGMQVTNIGDSMTPTLANGQVVLVNRLQFKILRPSTGDIIAFLPNGNANSHYYVKRVVASSGDKVQIIDGYLYVNGEKTEDTDEIYDKMEDAGIAANEIKLGSGEYFVLGDNRNSSEDSRSANIGIVKTNMIIGKVWFKLAGNDNSGGFILE
ncbi:signal peptidase I [Butyrivibrio sp. AE2015]|uniref:signal peptidase I n=1 Tax=Butyrivibrio sp. AE2015 TaxID=1280663 RepID=UPI0003B3420E|nr:signal peptidase I [Butyrivibrio sp. AE2015]